MLVILRLKNVCNRLASFQFLLKTFDNESLWNGRNISFFCFVILFLFDFFFINYFFMTSFRVESVIHVFLFATILFLLFICYFCITISFLSVIFWLDYYLIFSPWYWNIIMGLHSRSLFRHFSLDRHFVLFLALVFILTLLSWRVWNPRTSLKKVTPRKKLIMVTLCFKIMIFKTSS